MEHVRKIFRCWPLSLLISAILSSAPFLFMDIYYMYGDDYLMNYIANGSYGSTWSDHLIFPRIPFGVTTRFLYGITDSINWYCVLLVASIAVSYSVFHFVIARLSRNSLALMISLVMNAITVPMVLTFTSSAFLCVAAGAALLYYAAKSRTHTGVKILLGCLLALWGYIIRNDTLLPGLIMMGPAALEFFIEFLKSRGETRRSMLSVIWKLAAGALFSVLCLYGLRVWEQSAYSSEEWISFRAYNAARSSALDYPGVSYEQFAEVFQEIDFPIEQYTLMYRWSFGEKKAFSENKFAQVGAIIQNAYSTEARINYTKQELGRFPDYLIMIIPAILWLFLVFTDRGFKKWTASLEVLGLAAVLLALCFVRLRFLLRVSVPLSMIAVLAMLLLTEAPVKKDRGSISGICTAVVLLVTSGFFAKGFSDSVSTLRTRYYAESCDAALEEIRSHPERLYIVESSAFARMYYYGHPISEIDTIDDFRHVFRSGSWDTFSPRYYDLIGAFPDADPDNLYSTLLDNENAYLITDTPSHIRKYLEEIDGVKIRSNRQPLGDGAFQLCQLVTGK